MSFLIYQRYLKDCMLIKFQLSSFLYLQDTGGNFDTPPPPGYQTLQQIPW